MSGRNGLKSGIFEILTYLTVAAVYSYTTYCNQITAFQRSFEKIGINSHSSFGGRFKFLTFLNLLIQTSYFILCSLNALLEFSSSTKKIGALRKFLNGVYTSLIFPVGYLVCTAFWLIYFVDRNLIYSKQIESVIPSWQNHVLHTLPWFSALIDNFLTRHQFNSSFSKGVQLTLLFLATYFIWVFFIAFYAGFWVYPFMRVMTPIQLGLFFAVCFVFVLFAYKLGHVVNSFIWSKRELKVKSSTSSKKIE